MYKLYVRHLTLFSFRDAMQWLLCNVFAPCNLFKDLSVSGWVCVTSVSDELLSVADDCGKEDGKRCDHGACLDHQCHCNDGYGGCGCEVPGKYDFIQND